MGSLLGTLLQLDAGAHEQNAMNKTLSSQLNWQKDYQKTGQEVLNKHIQESSPQEAGKEITLGGQQAMDRYSALQSAPTGVAGSPSASSSVTGDDSKARAGIFNQAAAPVQGLSDWQVQQWIDSLKAKTMLNQNNQFSRMASEVLPASLDAAKNSRSGEAASGSLLNSLTSSLESMAVGGI